ncbi:hypothetical protein SAFG77S_00182 [Streptomyces afghaniensis]
MTTTFTSTTYASRGMRHRRPRRSIVPFLAQLVIWTGAAGVLALWWSDTTSVIGPAGWLTGAGRITGLLAGYACAVLLALMARIPLLDHTVGTDRLARWHALGGRCTISLTLAHTLLIIWGYSLTSHTNVVSQTSTLVLHYPDLLKGTAGFLLFLATGVLSARAARRKISYETWHYLHFATYLADLPHLRTPALQRRGLRRQPTRPGGLVHALPRRRSAGGLAPVRRPPTARTAPPFAGHGGASRGAGRGLRPPRRRAP